MDCVFHADAIPHASLGHPHSGSTVVSVAIDSVSELLILLLSRGPRDAGSEPHPSSMMHWPDNKRSSTALRQGLCYLLSKIRVQS